MKIQFESSTACNAKCVFCPRYDMTRPRGQMSDELFHKIIKEGKEEGIKLYSPFLNGEPFVFPKIYEWLDYMEKEGARVILYTNGEFLDADRLVKYSNIDYVNCSFNAATKETYDKIMRGPDFEKAKKNIENLISKARFRVVVSMIITEENSREQNLFKKMWGRRAKIGGYANWAGARRSSTEKKGKRRPCYHLLNHLTIMWDGRVNLCCMDHDGKVILGDLNKQSLKEIMGNMEPLRKRHRVMDFNMPLCRDCNLNTIESR